MNIQFIDGLILGQRIVKVQTIVLVSREHILLCKTKLRIDIQEVAACKREQGAE